LLLGTGIGFLVAPPLAAVAGATEAMKRLEPLVLDNNSNIGNEYV